MDIKIEFVLNDSVISLSKNSLQNLHSRIGTILKKLEDYPQDSESVGKIPTSTIPEAIISIDIEDINMTIPESQLTLFLQWQEKMLTAKKTRERLKDGIVAVPMPVPMPPYTEPQIPVQPNQGDDYLPTHSPYKITCTNDNKKE